MIYYILWLKDRVSLLRNYVATKTPRHQNHSFSAPLKQPQQQQQSVIRSEQKFPGSVGVIRLTESEAADGIGDADIFEEGDDSLIHLAAESGEGNDRGE